jgi:hypothetical protein
MWNAISEAVGSEPSTTQAKLQGRFQAELLEADIDPDEVHPIAQRLVLEWGVGKLTLSSLAKHWRRFHSSNPLTAVSDVDRDEFQAATMRQRRRDAIRQVARGSS